MNSALKIEITFDHVLALVKQLPVKEKIRQTKIGERGYGIKMLSGRFSLLS